MTSRPCPLEGKVVKAAPSVEDYVQVHFPDGTCLNIVNSVSFAGAASAGVEVLAERTLTTVTESAASVTLRFDDAYRGPEALELRVPGESIVVWR